MKKLSITTSSLIQLGDHRLLCGDAQNRDHVKQVLHNDNIDLILTDPPYGVAYVEGKEEFTKSKIKHRVIANDHEQTEEEYQLFTKQWMEAVVPFLARKNSCYVFNSDKMIFALKDGMESAGYRFTQLLIWAKTHSVVGRMDYHLQHELIAYCWHGTHTFYKAKDKSLLVYPKPNKSPLHATMKPVGLLRRLILNSTTIGQTVYEPFAGSGSTLIACEDTGRRCLAIEIDPQYCQTIVDRFEKHTGIQAIISPSSP